MVMSVSKGDPIEGVEFAAAAALLDPTVGSDVQLSI